ncbi:btgC [Candida theae]|uniref:glucan endo-1,3-beta-D-glucosidase n=1 Tax=Candida theae TaxID=1198502 RepID=A0AAD5BG75_9ASCO|nr:btgC [Candida theae]KAI5959440.1 btgC [Candida theae]
MPESIPMNEISESPQVYDDSEQQQPKYQPRDDVITTEPKGMDEKDPFKLQSEYPSGTANPENLNRQKTNASMSSSTSSSSSGSDFSGHSGYHREHNEFTAPNIPRRSHTPLTNEKGKTKLVKVNPYKIARAASFNVFMEYGTASASAALGSDSIGEGPRNKSFGTTPIDQPQPKEKNNPSGCDGNPVHAPTTATNQSHANFSNIYGSYTEEIEPSFTPEGELQETKQIQSTQHKVRESQSAKLPAIEKYLPRKEVGYEAKNSSEVKQVEVLELGTDANQPRVSKIATEPTLEKKKRGGYAGGYAGAINCDSDKSSVSLFNTDSEFVPNFHFDQSDKQVEKRDATVIYTKKSDTAPTNGQIQGNELVYHSSANSPFSDSTNRTGTGVKSKFGSDLISLNKVGQDDIESAPSSDKRLSVLKNFDTSLTSGDLANEKETKQKTSPSKNFKSTTFSWWKAGIVISVAVFIGAVLVGLVIALLILSLGTQDSVNHYFNDGKNTHHLRELVTKYLSQEDSFDVLTNSVDGLSLEVKSDNEVTDLMKGVTNVMFHGIAYSPNNAMEPYCGFSKRDAMLDLAKLSTVTTRIRTYGMQCDQAELILEAIERMDLNMTVAMGVWIGKNDTINRQQMDLMKKVVTRLPDPARYINSIFIGNEVLFRKDKSKTELINYIQDAKRFLQVMKINDIPVGTSEIGSLIDSDLLKNCDVVGANIQPFFGGVPVEDATHWVLRFLDLQILPYNENIGTPIVITEVGWPSGGGRYRYAQAGLVSLKVFLSCFLCTMRELPVEYYFFEAYDEPWKEVFWTPGQKWETQWGIFNADRSNKFTLQNIGCI